MLSYFGHVQNYFEIDGNLKIIVYLDRKTPSKIVIKQKRTRMVKVIP